VILFTAAISTAAACAQLIGADFDVHPADAGPDLGPDAQPPDAGPPDASCDAARCVEVIQGGLAYPWDITTSNGDVFWTVAGIDAGTGSVMSLPGDGGAVGTLASALNKPNRIFATDSTIYWTGADGVWRLPRAGGSAELVAAEPGGAIGLYVDANDVYWFASNEVKALSLADAGSGGTPITSAYGGAGMITGDGTYLYFDVYSTSGGIYKLDPTQPMTETPLATGLDTPDGLRVAGAYLLYTTAIVGGTVSYVPLGGGTPMVIADSQSTPSTLATDSNYVYWPTATGGEINRSLASGDGTTTTLVSGQTSPNGIAVDDRYVYWTSFDPDGAVLRTTK